MNRCPRSAFIAANAPAVWIGVWLLLLIAFGCTPAPPGETQSAPRTKITVAAASDLKFALDEIIGEFEQAHPDLDVEPTYGASGNLYAQIAQGAPFDLYLAADVAYVDKLAEQDLTAAESEFVYGVGRLALWVRSDSTLDLDQLGLQALLHESVRKIALANPRHAPYGRAAEQTLQSAGMLEQLQDKLVFGENVAQAAHFVESGAADIGLIAMSLARSPAMNKSGRAWPVPREQHAPLEQGGAILRAARDPEATKTFRNFLLGPQGRAILQRYHFQPPGE